MKILAFIMTLFATFSPCYIEVTANRASVFTYQEGALEESFVLYHNDVAYATSQSEIEGLMYLYISVEGKGEGYILKSATVKQENDIVYKPEYNGIVDNDSTLYLLVDNIYTPQDISVTKGTEIKIIDGYDTKKEYTKVMVYVNNSVLTGYLKTSDLHGYGINPNLVIGISLICTILGIIFILMGIKLVKKKNVTRH